MVKLKIAALPDAKPVKVMEELPATIHRDLIYAEILAHHSGLQTIGDPLKLIAPMLARFMASDRAFAKLRKTRHETEGTSGTNQRKTLA